MHRIVQTPDGYYDAEFSGRSIGIFPTHQAAHIAIRDRMDHQFMFEKGFAAPAFHALNQSIHSPRNIG